MAKQEVHGCFCSPIQSPGCRENIEYATFSTQPSDCGQWGLFQRECPSDSLFKKEVVTPVKGGVRGDVGCQGFHTQLLQIIMQFLNLSVEVGTPWPVSAYPLFCLN